MIVTYSGVSNGHKQRVIVDSEILNCNSFPHTPFTPGPRVLRKASGVNAKNVKETMHL